MNRVVIVMVQSLSAAGTRVESVHDDDDDDDDDDETADVDGTDDEIKPEDTLGDMSDG